MGREEAALLRELVESKEAEPEKGGLSPEEKCASRNHEYSVFCGVHLLLHFPKKLYKHPPPFFWHLTGVLVLSTDLCVDAGLKKAQVF